LGRISHAVYGTRDLAKTAAFFEKYCGIEPEHDSKTAEGTLVLRLRAGGRLVYKLVDNVDERVSGHGTWWDMHTALTVRDEEFLPNYRRMWDGIPEEAGYKADLNLTIEQQEALPGAPVCIAAPSASGGRKYAAAAMSSTTGTAIHFTSSAANRSKPTAPWRCTRRSNRRITCLISLNR